MPFDIDNILNLQLIFDVQLSPDGEYVAYVIGHSFKAGAEMPPEKNIHLVEVETGKSRVLTTSNIGSNTSPRWSPDSKHLAFTSNRLNKQHMQVFLIDIHGGEAQALTDLYESVHWLAWLPDGQGLTFLCNDNLGNESPDPIVMDENPVFQRLWILDIETDKLHPVTPPNYHIHEYATSPDGKAFAVVASTHPNPMQGWYAAGLYTVSVADDTLQPVCDITHQVGRLTWSPDGQAIAFISGVMSDEGSIAGEVYTVPMQGGIPKNLTPEIDHTITWISWQDKGILYGARHVEAALLGWLDPESGVTRQISHGMYAINGSREEAVSVQGNMFAAIRESYQKPPGIYIGSLEQAEWRQLTAPPIDLNLFPPLHVENKYWTHADGTPSHGYLVFPPGYQPGKPYPMVVNVHGGPSLSTIPSYSSTWVRLFIDRGCIVFLPNPRGSWGRGHAYQSANVGDLGGGDWQDVMAGIDMLVNDGTAASDQLAIAGWSYAGFLVTWAVTQTDRFRCAIAGASITNYVSNYGVVLNREWQSTMFGSNVYDQMDLHWSRSPIKHIKHAKTPTLLVHGQEDKLAPVQQSIEFYMALRYLGIPTQLAIYPREPHGIEERNHQRDLLQRIGEWLDQYLLGV